MAATGADPRSPGPTGERSIAAIRAGLAEHADADIAAGQQRYMKSAMPFRGLRTPTMNRVVRPLLQEQRLPGRAEWEATVRALWDDAEFREERYAAVSLAAHRHYREHQDPDTLALYEHMIVTGAWWDHVDTIAIHLVGPIQRAHRPALDATMRAWATDEDMWLRRTAIIHQNAAKGDTDDDLLADVILPNLVDPEFFIRKAIGWALREYAKTDDVWVRRFVDVHGDAMSGLSRREAMKHLR